MRFYTAVINDKEELLVGFEQGARAYRLSLLARLMPKLAFADMNALALKEATLLRRLAEEKERYYSLLLDHIHKELKRGK